MLFRSEGWGLAKPVPGFWMSSCLKRTLPAAEDTGSRPVVHAIFSDGLTHVSVFIEPVDPARPARSDNGAGAQIGATSTLRQRRGEHQITVMGDVPPSTLQAFVDALERRR